ncbi:MAG: hypothetical protein ABSG81_15455 [Acidimicrobiales bacterium]
MVTRTLAAALALGADVHVVTPQGDAPARVADGAFEVHLLGNEPDTRLAVRRALVAEAVVSAPRPAAGAGAPTEAAGWLRASADLWRGAPAVLAGIDADLAVVAGHRHLGLVEVLPDAVPVVSVPLCAEPQGLGHPLFDPLPARAAAVLVSSDAERSAVMERSGLDPSVVHDVGSVVPVNPSVLEEPSTELAGQEYILVTGTGESDASQARARLLALRFPRNPVVVVQDHRLVIWRKGEAADFEAVSRHIDLWRLMAWARCTVDLHPGRLLALRCIESLLFATPVVVPERTRARHVVAESGGGLWFSDGAELIACLEALLDQRNAKQLGEKGRAHAHARYGERAAFVERVTTACGVATRS